MLRFGLLIITLAAVYSVPIAPILQPNVYQQYLLLTPQAQLELAPALKLKQPILAPVQYKRFDLKQNQELLVYYPNSPLIQYPQILTYRDEAGEGNEEGGGSEGGDSQGDDFNWGTFIQGIQNIFVSPGGNVKSSPLEFEKDAEVIPKMPMPITPANTYPLIPNQHRFYILSGAPQFYGNFAGLNDPSNPLFRFPQIQVKSRSVGGEAEKIESEQNVELQALKASPLAEQPQQVEKVIDSASQLNENQKLNSEDEVQARFQSSFPAILNQAQEEDSVALEGKKENLEQQEKKGDEILDLKASDDPSVARATPVGIALTGRGGLASSRPIGTALAGNGGLALSSPQATSVAGDFLGDGENDKV